MSLLNPRLLGVAIVLSAAAMAGCSGSSAADDGDLTEGALGGAAGMNPRWVGPVPGTKNNPVDDDLVLTAWKKVARDFYGVGPNQTTPTGYNPAANPPVAEVGQCIAGATPPFWSDLMAHFYCWHPSYQPTNPNIRACFSGATRGLQVTESGAQARKIMYPEAYDHCVYQQANWVAGGSTTFDRTTIDSNKGSKTMPGALAWVKNNEDEAFRYVMFSWYDPNTLSYAEQQRVINKFYQDIGMPRFPRNTDATATASGNPSLTPHPEAARLQQWMTTYYNDTKDATGGPAAKQGTDGGLLGNNN